MTSVNGPRGLLRLAGSRWLRLACRGLSRPGWGVPVTEAMTVSDARNRRSARRGGKGARAAGRAADHVERVRERDPQRVLPGQGGGGADDLADRVIGAQQRPDLLLG